MNTNEPVARKPIRVWPGITAAVLLLLARFGLPAVAPDQTIYGVLGGVAGALAIVVWWLLFSRAPWSERLGVVVLMIVGVAATWQVVDVSISTGAMGGLLPMLAIPPLAVAFVVSVVASRHLADGPRRATMAATILVACGAWTLAKTGGFSTSFDNDLMWRWAQTPEDRLVADPAAALPPAVAEVPRATILGPSTVRPVDSVGAAAAQIPLSDSAARNTPAATATVPSAATTEPGAPSSVDSRAGTRAAWDGFRGPQRDGIVRSVRIETDWSTKPPVALWRRPVGPGWSSFAVHGNLIYTQEQRGHDEVVACYDLATGTPVWSHRDAARFWESNGGAGPRATPTFHNGRVYAFGATGILNALDASSGARVWSHNVASDTGTDVPMWGFASSPLVVGDAVIIAASGTLAAYDLATGNLRWVGPHHGNTSYSSPHRVTIDGVDQIVLLSEAGATSVAPIDGAVLWEHALAGAPIIQPAPTADGGLLIHFVSPSGALAIRRLTVEHGPGGWTTRERWTSTGLKTMFNDFVIHNGHAFGFDGSILASVDLEDGQRKWKGGRYGSGQLVLIADQDVLLVLSEEGELALVGATTDRFQEIARVPAIEGKTWNHPVLVGDVLLVRNGEEMAAFRLSLADRSKKDTIEER